jgi:hypothetical protein
VEGEPDRLFYRQHIHGLGINLQDIFIYNCDGKAAVYQTYQDIIARYPSCIRTLFFVDKDVDDIVGRQWPTDPRIFVTKVYSVENYVICREAMNRYFSDFVKVRRVEISIDSALDRFEQELEVFHRKMLSIMAWIVVARRSGSNPNLNNINLGEIFEVSDNGLKRRQRVSRFDYLKRTAGVNQPSTIWRQVHLTCKELRRLPAKCFVRGKFEAWFFVGAGCRISDGLRRVSAETGSSVGVSAQLTTSSFIQLLSGGIPPPSELSSFLKFHLLSVSNSSKAAVRNAPKGYIRRRLSVLSGLWKRSEF